MSPIDDICGNLTIVVNSTLSVLWSELPTPYFKFPGTVPAYLRPDGEALLPWVFTLIVIIVHLPFVVLRVVRWELAQTWCFVFTGFTIIVYIQAYVSTKFGPGDVFVWTPLLLVIDAGSMSQIFFLINEDIYLKPQATRAWKWWLKRVWTSCGRRSVLSKPAQPGIPLQNLSQKEQAGQRNKTEGEIFIARVSSIIAAILFIIIIVLQVLGLVYAVVVSHNPEPPPVRWCSPIFQPFGLAVRDGNCNIHPIDQSFNKGIGCITLQGIQQAGWITGTIWGTSISLFLELGDVIILSFTHKSTRIRDGVKMRRPWCTIFTGLVGLSVMLLFGILYSRGLPEGITESIWVVVQDGDQLLVYEGHLVGAGMRGEVIGWFDALFKSWGAVYFGNEV